LEIQCQESTFALSAAFSCLASSLFTHLLLAAVAQSFKLHGVFPMHACHFKQEMLYCRKKANVLITVILGITISWF